MGNRIKCKLCNSIMMAKDADIITCQCGELVIDGVKKTIICKKSTSNYCEVDDEDNEIVALTVTTRPDKKALLAMLDDMIKGIDELPPLAMQQPITHYDLSSALVLLSAILRSD